MTISFEMHTINKFSIVKTDTISVTETLLHNLTDKLSNMVPKCVMQKIEEYIKYTEIWNQKHDINFRTCDSTFSNPFGEWEISNNYYLIKKFKITAY